MSYRIEYQWECLAITREQSPDLTQPRFAIAIEGYDQVLEIDSPLDGGAALGDRIPLELTNARVFPTGEGVLRGDGEGI